MAMCTSLPFSGSQFTLYMGITMPTANCDVTNLKEILPICYKAVENNWIYFHQIWRHMFPMVCLNTLATWSKSGTL